MADVTSITSKKSFVSLLPANFISLELIILASPVWKIAPPTTKSPIIITTTLLENPERASAGVSILKTNRATSEHKATISERTRPFTKKTTDSSRIKRVIIIISNRLAIQRETLYKNNFAKILKIGANSK